ncbi:uncharacterized protein METZ01_LOCUS432383, partial [marine metagenome]
FIAGVGPAILLTTMMAVYAVVRNRRQARQRWQTSELIAALRNGIWALLMPVIILGGIYTGYFTPTESAAVAVVYAIVVEMLIHRELDWSGLHEVVAQTSQLLGALFPVLMMALSLNVFLTYQQVPEQLVHWLSGLITNSTTFLLGTNLFLLLTGCLMDIGSAILILAPMLQPIAAEQGLNAVHFGIIMVVNLEMGYLTPPLGLNIIVAMTVFKEEFWTICRAVLPFLAMMVVGLLLVSFLPQLSLFLLD